MAQAEYGAEKWQELGIEKAGKENFDSSADHEDWEDMQDEYARNWP